MASWTFLGLMVLLGFVLSPTGSTQMDLQGRLVSAPPPYVRQKLFDADFVHAIVQESGKNDFFYPLRLREQGELSSAGQQRDEDYARKLGNTHKGFNSKVRATADTVSHVNIEEASPWKTQKIIHMFTFSEMKEMEGYNHTCTILEYTKVWKGSIVLRALQDRQLLTQWIGDGLGERIDAKSLDLFWKAVEQAWLGYRGVGEGAGAGAGTRESPPHRAVKGNSKVELVAQLR